MKVAHVALVALLTGVLAGCTDPTTIRSECGDFFDMYRDGPDERLYQQRGGDKGIIGEVYGSLLHVTNPYDRPMMLRPSLRLFEEGRIGEVTEDGWRPIDIEGVDPSGDTYSHTMPDHLLDPGEAVLYRFEGRGFKVSTPEEIEKYGESYAKGPFAYAVHTNWMVAGDDATYTFAGPVDDICRIGGDGNSSFELITTPKTATIDAGDTVSLHIVGTRTDGSVVYHTGAAWAERPSPPGGDAAYDDGPLPVYLYHGRPEEAAARCDLPLFEVLNEQVKGQHIGTTNVTFLRPEEAFTRPGWEGHPLHGEPLLFQITLVEHRETGFAEPSQECPRPHQNAPTVDTGVLARPPHGKA